MCNGEDGYSSLVVSIPVNHIMADSAETNTIAVNELRQWFEIQAENPILSPTPHSKSSKVKPRLSTKPKFCGTGAMGFQHDTGDTQGDTSAPLEIDSKEKAEAGSSRNVADEEDIKALGDLREAEQDTSAAQHIRGNSVFYLNTNSHHGLVDDQGDKQTKEDIILKKTVGTICYRWIVLS